MTAIPPPAPPPDPSAPPSPPGAPAPAADPVGSVPAGPAAPAAPNPGERRAGKLRFQAKVAGVMMMLFGAFFGVNFALDAYNGPHLAEQDAAVPGGNLTVAFPQAPNATVTLLYRSGAPATVGRLDGNGTLLLHASNATFTVQVASGGATWTRAAFLPAGAADTLRLDPAAPRQSDERVGIATAFYVWFWLPALACALLAAGGYFAFRLRGPRLALGGALLFVLGAALLVWLFGVSLFALAFVGTAALCFAFVYRARAEFLPLGGF